MRLITDHKWKPFKYSYEVPDSVLKDQFDYLDDETIDGFILYRKCWYHLSDFLTLTKNDHFPNEYHGYHSDSAFSGILIQLSDDGEAYKIATYLADTEKSWNLGANIEVIFMSNIIKISKEL